MKGTIVLFVVFALSTLAFGQGNYRASNVSMTIKGSSNLHDWESSAKEVRARGSIILEANTLKSIPSFSVEVPVKSIKSAKGSIMDGKTYDALKADQYPNITYTLEKVTGLNKKGENYDLYASGSLSMAGASNKIDLYVKVKVNADGSLTFSGSKKLKMTDYKIDPPKALFGTLTTGNDVEIVFQVTVKQI